MQISKKFNKLMLASIFSALFAATAFSQGSYAAIITPPTDDFTININMPYISPNTGDLLVQQFGPQDVSLSFLKFDISSLKNNDIDSVTLELFGHGWGTVNVYHVANDAWVNQDVNKPVEQATMDYLTNNVIGLSNMSNPISSAALDGDMNNKTYDFIFNNLNDFISDANGSGEFSIALLASDQSYFTSALFSPNEGVPEHAAMLDVDAEPVPSPEPSSMILGIMGLGSMLGLRKKRS